MSVRIRLSGPYGGIIQRLEYPAFNRSIRVRVPVPLPYKNIFDVRHSLHEVRPPSFDENGPSVFLYGNVALR